MTSPSLDDVLRIVNQLSKEDKRTLIRLLEARLSEATDDEPRDALGWPIGYFEETYGSMADDPIERRDQGAGDDDHHSAL
jgi:hypothetical protein